MEKRQSNKPGKKSETIVERVCACLLLLLPPTLGPRHREDITRCFGNRVKSAIDLTIFLCSGVF